MRDEKARGPEGSRELRAAVQAFAPAEEARRLREEHAYREHGRDGLTLVHEPRLRVVLTAMTAGRRIEDQRAAGPLLLQVVEGEFIFEAGGERHELGTGQMIVLQSDVPYEIEARQEGAFLHVLFYESGDGGEEVEKAPHPDEPAEGAPEDVEAPGAERA